MLFPVAPFGPSDRYSRVKQPFAETTRNGQDAPILFSNGSMGSGSFERYRRLGVSAFSTCSWALDGVSWVQGGSVEIAVGRETACYRIDAVICALPGRRSARELG